MHVELALSGCSSRLTAHLGFLQALQDRGVMVDRIRASSGGGLMGALWASGLPLNYLESELQRIDFSQFGAMGIQDYFRGVFSGFVARQGSDNFWKLLRNYFEGRKLGEVKIPLELMVSDMTAGELIVLTPEKHPELPLAEAVYLSCLIPGHFRPHIFGDSNHIYRDGSLYKDFPIDLEGDPNATRIGHKVEAPWAPTTETSPWTIAHELFLVISGTIDANVDASVAAVAKNPKVVTVVTSVSDISVLDFSISPEKKKSMRLDGYAAGLRALSDVSMGSES